MKSSFPRPGSAKRQLACAVALLIGSAAVAGTLPDAGDAAKARVEVTGSDAEIRIRATCRGNEPLNVCLCPDGTTFDVYRFAFAPGMEKLAEFYSENGGIRPDGYAPAWRVETKPTADGFAAEAVIPASALYMTRNAAWRQTWCAKAMRTKSGDRAPLEKSAFAPEGFSKVGGFAFRAQKYDCAIRSAVAQVTARTGSGYSGELLVDVYVAVAGEYDLRVGDAAPQRVKLTCGRPNKVKVPASFVRLGSQVLHLSLGDPSGETLGECDCRVAVAYEPVKIRLTTPCYRDSFYPGQVCARIAGVVDCAGTGGVALTARGAGAATAIDIPVRDGRFAFDVPADLAFPITLSAACGQDVATKTVRKVEPDGHRMTWIEDGNIVLDGKPVFKRAIYAQGLTVGKAFARRFAAEKDSFMLTDQFTVVDVARTLHKFEATECRRDVRPSEAALAAVKAAVDAAKGRDYGLIYICDEPECRGVSPVYLRHVYEYLKEIDPRHIVYLSSRDGRRYVECADLLETHPYLGCRIDENGRRTYRRPPSETGDYIDAFGCDGRKDKAVGFLNTCFSSRWDSLQEDYPTYDEYVAHSWAALAHGAKSFWPYAGHDLGDRPALYHGVRQMFRTAAALEPFLLHGTRRVLERSREREHAVWERDGEKLDLEIDFRTLKTRVSMPAAYQKAIGPTQEETGRLVAREEAERRGRDNQLRGRYGDIAFTSNMRANHGGGFYKLIDGTLDMCARYSAYQTNAMIQASFTRMTPVFDRIRLWGLFDETVGEPQVSIRKGGVWRTLRPKKVVREGLMTELDFGEAHSTVRLRIDFPGKTARRNDVELYELELPRCKAGVTAAVRKTTSAAVDEGVFWKWSGADDPLSEKYSNSAWFPASPETFVKRPSGGFTLRKTAGRFADLPAGSSWLVMDFDRFVAGPGYLRWDASLGKLGCLASTITYPIPGIYTIELPAREAAGREMFQLRLWGFEVDVNSVALMKSPANRVICRGPKGKDRVVPGDEILVGVQFAEPCEDVAAEFLAYLDTGHLWPYAVNGTSAIELRDADGDGRRWYAKVKVNALPRDAGPRQVYVKASALGGSFDRPVLGNFAVPFSVR